MKFDLFTAEANVIWEKAAGRSASGKLSLELDFYKKLLSFFQVGDYYYIVFYLMAFEFELVSKEVEPVLGYKPADFKLKTLMENIHPDDRPYFLDFENKAGEFLAGLAIEKLMKYKIRYDYRIRRNDGGYVRILHQCMVVDHDENGGIIRTFAIHTDISHLKAAGKPVLSIIGMEGEPSFINIDVTKVFSSSKEILSKREKQVLTLLIEGKLSKEIAEALNISKQTVDKHRKNMIGKNNVSNTAELISKAIKNGWL